MTSQNPSRSNSLILAKIRSGVAGFAACALVSFCPSSNAAVIFSNSFDSNTNGFTAGILQVLPTDSGGFASSNTSNYLGLFDSNDFTDLSLSGLTAGTVYGVSFDLFTGRSLDGTVGPGAGPDRFTLSAGVTTLVDATFANIGANQTYSDATPTAGLVGSNPSLTGADQAFSAGGTFGNYGIYYFSHGAATNPQLSFLATGPTATLRFAASGLQDQDDEFFAIDNVIISAPDVPGNGTAVPDTGTTLFLLGGTLLAMAYIRRVATV